MDPFIAYGFDANATQVHPRVLAMPRADDPDLADKLMHMPQGHRVLCDNGSAKWYGLPEDRTAEGYVGPWLNAGALALRDWSVGMCTTLKSKGINGFRGLNGVVTDYEACPSAWMLGQGRSTWGRVQARVGS